MRDDGRGFSEAKVPDERLGLRISIRDRIAKVGGNADIVSAPGEGTTVTILWPAAQQRQADASALHEPVPSSPREVVE